MAVMMAATALAEEPNVYRDLEGWEIAACGTSLPRDFETGWIFTGLACRMHSNRTYASWMAVGYKLQDSDPELWYAHRRPDAATCADGQRTTANLTRAARDDFMALWDISNCNYPAGYEAPPPAPGGPGAGWECRDEWDEDPLPSGYRWCHKYDEEESEYRVIFTTPCSTFSGMVPGEDMLMVWDAFVNTDCEVDAPTPPDGTPACVGADGLACENTLRDVRYLLQQMLQRDQQPITVSPIEVPPMEWPDAHVPQFDRSQPSFEGWVAPEFTDDETDELFGRIVDGLAALRAESEVRFPFGLDGWVPELVGVEGGVCNEPELALFGLEARPIGWCDSAVETFLAGFARAGLLFLMTIGFGFAVVRTVALS